MDSGIGFGPVGFGRCSLSGFHSFRKCHLQIVQKFSIGLYMLVRLCLPGFFEDVNRFPRGSAGWLASRHWCVLSGQRDSGKEEHGFNKKASTPVGSAISCLLQLHTGGSLN